MGEKRVALNGAQDRHPDWATLITDAVDEVTRILRSEANVIRVSIGAALRAEVNYALAVLAMAGALMCAAICALAAVIVFLHQSHPDLNWQGTVVASAGYRNKPDGRRGIDHSRSRRAAPAG
jgi:hypothetical protein